jgi:hypothetical protein
MIKLIALLITNVWAHCPVSFKPEKVCLMFDQNTLFVYDHKLEHNGPYKDFINSNIISISNNSKSLPFKKVARGIYKIETPSAIPFIEVTIENNKIKNTYKVSK